MGIRGRLVGFRNSNLSGPFFQDLGRDNIKTLGNYIASGGTPPPSQVPGTPIFSRDFENNPTLGPGETWDGRGSEATYIDSNGQRQVAAVDVPRFDHSQGYGALLLEPAVTNEFLNSQTPATQTVVLTGGTEYVFWIEGSGSMALSGGASGVVTEGNPIKATVTGNVTCTISGDVTFAQVEANSWPTSAIYTAGAPGARAADAVPYWALASPQAEGSVLASIKTALNVVDSRVGYVSFQAATRNGPAYSNGGNNQLRLESATDANAIVTLGGVVEFEEIITLGRWAAQKQASARWSGGWKHGTPVAKTGNIPSGNVVSVGTDFNSPVWIRWFGVYDYEMPDEELPA